MGASDPLELRRKVRRMIRIPLSKARPARRRKSAPVQVELTLELPVEIERKAPSARVEDKDDTPRGVAVVDFYI